VFTADKRHGVLSLTVSKRSEDRSYEGFIDEFMDWWVDELSKRNEKGKSQAKEYQDRA
jgi:hypothetical protein